MTVTLCLHELLPSDCSVCASLPPLEARDQVLDLQEIKGLRRRLQELEWAVLNLPEECGSCAAQFSCQMCVGVHNLRKLARKSRGVEAGVAQSDSNAQHDGAEALSNVSSGSQSTAQSDGSIAATASVEHRDLSPVVAGSSPAPSLDSTSNNETETDVTPSDYEHALKLYERIRPFGMHPKDKQAFIARIRNAFKS